MDDKAYGVKVRGAPPTLTVPLKALPSLFVTVPVHTAMPAAELSGRLTVTVSGVTTGGPSAGTAGVIV